MQSIGDTNPKPEIGGKKISNYVFNFSDLIGQGNFSKVYQGRNEITDEIVAIKIVELNRLKSKKLEELLDSEIQILQKLEHPNVLKCHEICTSNRNCYIITELCNEGDLQSKLRSKKLLKESQADKYIQGIFKGLLYLSDNHIIHRDLKVANIFIKNGQAKIADFGFAKMTKQKFKDVNIGSPIYMAPQGLINNTYGPKTDIWAFGMLIYELLHGKTPFSQCKTEKQLKNHISIPIGWNQLNPYLSIDIKEVILKCLQIDENKRIQIDELKKLPYFKQKDLNALKFSIKENGVKGSYQLDTKKPLSSKEAFKKRMQIENQVYPKKTKDIDEIKEIYPSLYRYKKPISHIKLPLEEQKNLRLSSGNHYSSTTNFTSTSRKHPDYPQQQQSSRKKYAVLSTSIAFKQCVYILHYCRLIYKHLIMMRDMDFGDENQSNIFKHWLSIILKTLIRQINENHVIFSGDNKDSRQYKLEEVINQYITKYSKDLHLDISKIKLEQSSTAVTYEKIQKYFFSVYQMIDHKIQKDGSNLKLVQLGHSIIVICQNTKIMCKCYEQKNYKYLENFKKIQEFLNLSKVNLNLPSYQWYKKKYPLSH